MSTTKATSIRNEPVWTATAQTPKYPPLKENIQTDVCIVGAGIAGLTTAYLLVQEGKRVVLLDDGPIAGGMTAVTSAHLANAIDNRYVEIERMHGEEGARLAAESHTAAIDRIESIVKRENIDCDFERLDGYLFQPIGERDDLLDRELAAAHRAGLTGVEKVEQAPLDSFDTGPCLRFPDQGQFHPLKYLAGLAKAIERDGGRIYCKSHANRIDDGSPARIKVGRRNVTADAVVVATNTPVNDLVAIHTKQAPYMTYVIGALVPRGSVAKALYWDTQDPYHYVRLQKYAGKSRSSRPSAFDLLIVGGEDHKTGHADDGSERYERLEAWAHERFPLGEVKFTWSGQVMEPVDGVAFIGRNPMDEENVFIATGDSGMGLTHGTIAGILLTDLILGRENPWSSLYDPSRKTVSAAGEFVKENLDVAAQYTDLVTGGDVSSVDEIPNDSGAIIRRGLGKVAVYRDAKGKLSERSAICPHLGCVVRWNSTKKTWDCPCHGSRFDKRGKVSNGPSNRDLEKAKSE